MARSLLPASSLVVLPLAALALVASGCSAVGPDYAVPEVPTPDYWNAQVRDGMHTSRPDITKWWYKFNDSTLNKLIALAETQNRDLAITAERIEEARALSGIARGGLSPYAAASGSVGRFRSSESLPSVGPNPTDFYDAGIAAGWEMDFVGGLRRSVEAAEANLAATEEFHRDAMVIVFAEIATAYIDYRTLQRRINLAKANIENQKKWVEFTRNRQEQGIDDMTAVSQSETILASTEALVPQLQIQLIATRNRIAVLAGRYPGALAPILGNSDKIPSPATSISVGLPADLIRSRPDIRAAERQLAAQTARIGVATAELYPKFTLSGTFALQSNSSSDFFDSDSRAYGFGPSFQWRVFEGGRIRESIKAQESRTRQALFQYEKVILGAVSEVETALVAIQREKQRKAKLDKSAASARQTISLLNKRYDEGLSVIFLNVLDAERSVVSSEDNAAATAGLVARDHVALYRALGGGMQVPTKVLQDKK